MDLNSISDYFKVSFKTRKIRAPFYLLISSILLIFSLVLFEFLSNYVYVVMIDDREVGVVHNAKEVEVFVEDLAERCGELYGMHIKPGKKIEFVKEFRPNSYSEPESVQQTIRSTLDLLTEANMLKVNGSPVLALSKDSEIDQLISALKDSYTGSQENVVTIDSVVTDQLTLEQARVEPTAVITIEEAVAYLVSANSGETLQVKSLTGSVSRGFFSSRYSGNLSSASLPNDFSNGKMGSDAISAEPITVNVRTLEELTVQEAIPFATEIEYDDEMWIVQQDVVEPGRDGIKEITYHVSRENSREVARSKIQETVIKEPVTQLEVHGTAQVPDIGSGRFVWPVEDGGEITPGRGFSDWHTGIDIAADLGVNILAADCGIVWFSGRGGSQGNYIIIYHGSYWTLYLHNEVNLVNKGDQVEKGEIIGRVGSTGRSSGPHLHFEIRLDDGTGEWMGYYQHKPIDPLRFFNP